jgi:hypothetical protein
MKYTQYMFALLSAAVVLSMSQSTYARWEVIDDEDEFHQLLEGNKYMIVHFNPYQEDSDADQALEDMKKAFFAVAHKGRYASAGIMFAGANVPEITMHEPDLLEEFDEIGVDQKVSTIMLFRNGKPVVLEDNTVVKKVGDKLTEADIEDFIEKRWGKRIDRILESLQRQEPSGSGTTVRYVTTTSYPTYRPWYRYSAYPYDNWAYYSYAPTYGIGLGGGLGYGWRGGWGGRGWRGGWRPGWRGGWRR